MFESIPRVSIGLPVYNGQDFLAAAIDSMLAQSFTDFELIISDNGSTDRTPEICRRYAALDKRIRYYRESENRGLAWNFNRAFELARGEYFKWHAHDDLCAPTLLEKCVAVLDHDPSIVLCFARPMVIDHNGKPLPDDPTSWQPTAVTATTRDQPTDLGSTKSSRRFRGILMGVQWCLAPYGLMRSEITGATGGMRDYLIADKVFLAEMALRGRFFEIPEVLFFPRRHARQFSLASSASTQRNMMKPRARRFSLPVPWHVRPTIDYFRATLSTPIGWSQRLACFAALVRYLFQVGKWRRIIVNAMRDASISERSLVAP
jgi:glycosyltransferase involved in cell wall biosynthesis